MPKKEPQIPDYIDSKDPDALDFVTPLIESLSSLKIEKIDLTTVEGAKKALAKMIETQKEITTYQKQVRTLKAVLEEQKFRSEE